MRRRILVCLFVCFTAAGCNKDAEIKTSMNELNAFTTELIQKVESAQGSIEGIDSAQRFFESKKAEMEKKLSVLKGARGFQVSDEAKKSMTESLTQNVTNVASLQLKYMGKSIKDPSYKSKLEKLVKDYQSLLTS
jgi:predicted TIM-barrel fold metal-dependent hydrolase